MLHRHLDISRSITAESSPLHIASSRTRTEKPGFRLKPHDSHAKIFHSINDFFNKKKLKVMFRSGNNYNFEFLTNPSIQQDSCYNHVDKFF